ncbi:MAG: SDR family oxidoreductase [Dehalococcoidia bacterium]
MSTRPVVLVTGGAKRVGRAIARAFARSGCDLVLTFNTSSDAADGTAKELSALGADVRLEHVNLEELTTVEFLGDRLARDLPRLDVLVHNASEYEPSPLSEVTGEDLLRNYRVNAAAPLLLSKTLAPLLAASVLPGGGAIVAMCDMHAMGRPRRDFAVYSMSKAALAEMVRSLARDLAPRIRVNGVAPGVVAFPDEGPESDPKMQQKYISHIPLARVGTPADAAEVVRWLALDAHYVTGEIVRVDGGRWLA